MRGMRQRSVRLCVWPVFFAGILCFSGPQHHVGRGLSRHVPSCTRRALPKLDSLALTQARVVRHDDSGTIVCLVGCMHFNPFSTFCAKSLTTEMMESNALAAVVLEMFDERWQRMQRLHPGGSFMRSLLDNEMQGMAEAVEQGAVPVVFGDLSDEELDSVLQDVATATLADAGSISGWTKIWYDVANCCTTLLSSPKQESHLGVSSGVTLGSFVAPLLLLAMTPIAVIRNLLVLGMEAPNSITAGLLLMGLLIPAFTLFAPARPLEIDSADPVPRSDQPGWLNWVVLPSLALAILAIWRVQLRAILTDRDVHIARRIADTCNKYGGRQKVVLAVVGALHLAGISKLVGKCEADDAM